MPAEWSEHERCWMMWPCRAEVWPDIEATRKDYTTLAHAIRGFEPLTMTVNPEDEAEARSMLGSDIDIAIANIDDSWARDAGPCFLKNADGDVAGLNFKFNAWGEKYHPYDGDNKFSEFVLAQAGVRQFHSDLIAEGGGICVDGEGTILTTQTCFPNANRNPDWTIAEIEQELIEVLGGDKVIWLPGNEYETETNGHVDGIAMFAEPGTILVEMSENPNSLDYGVNRENHAALDGQVDAKGRQLKLVPVPDADDAKGCGDMFCRSYVNSYIANGGILMPKYDIATDDQVREIYQEHFPGREVVQVSINNIALGGGGIHCITQQEPL